MSEYLGSQVKDRLLIIYNVFKVFLLLQINFELRLCATNIFNTAWLSLKTLIDLYLWFVFIQNLSGTHLNGIDFSLEDCSVLSKVVS